jgi:ferritin
MAGSYTFPAAWQDEHPFPSSAHWEVSWSEEKLSFVARLFEHYSEDEIDEGLIQSPDEPVLAYGETFREVLDTDRLATLMDEKIPPDIELRLIRDQTESLNRQGVEELERRVEAGC